MTERFGVGAFEPVYDPSVGEPERWYINDHTFVRDHEGTWHLIGITHAEPAAPFDELHFAHATAPALHGPWAKQSFALSTDPESGETHLWAPHVIEHDSTYWMYYCAGGAEKTEYRIHLATSTDCITWTRHPENPMVVDGFEARDPMVLWVDGRWVLYYTATSEPAGGAFIVAAAESHYLVHWGGRHTVYRDELTGTGGRPTESPFVVSVDGTYSLLIGPDWEDLVTSHERTGRYDPAAYRRTRVLASHDPLHFDLDGLVALVDAHAAEVIVDEAGHRWMSHCGWGQRGVFLAPLTIGAD